MRLAALLALAVGMPVVLVNGRIAVDRGALTGVAAGRPLPHRATGSRA